MTFFIVVITNYNNYHSIKGLLKAQAVRVFEQVQGLVTLALSTWQSIFVLLVMLFDKAKAHRYLFGLSSMDVFGIASVGAIVPELVHSTRS